MRILKAVRNGVELLDRAFGPGWEDMIDLSTLEMSSTCNCVLGQIQKSIKPKTPRTRRFGALARKLRILHQTERYGFDAGRTRKGTVINYARLNSEWRRLIGGRRAAKLTEAA